MPYTAGFPPAPLNIAEVAGAPRAGHEVADFNAIGAHVDMISAELAAFESAASGGIVPTFSVVTADKTGTTDVWSSLSTADALSADKWLPAGLYQVSTSGTLSGRWWFEKGAKLSLSTNVVLTFSGSIVDTGDTQLFDVSAAGARVQLDGFSAFARPEWWGCKGDWQHVTDAAIASGTAVLTSPTGRWTAADVGKNIGVPNAQTDGSGHFNLTLTTTILSYQSATQVTLAANATATVTGGEAQWWTNDQAAMQQCINGVAGATHKHIRLSKTYVCHRSGTNAWAIDLSKRGTSDGVTTSGSPNISSATAHFTKADEGQYLAGGSSQIPPAAKILRVTSPTTAVMNVNALASSTTRVFIVPLSNLTISAVKGQGYIKHPTGMPNASVAVVRANGNTNLTLLGVGFDGNWGNFVGNSQAGPPGVNHVFQSDPKNYGIDLRGVTECVLDYCDFTQTYGDMMAFHELAESDVWPGSEANRALDVRVDHCTGDMAARDGAALGAMCERITFHACTFTNVHTQGVDLEPQGTFQYVRDVVVDNCKITGWFDKTLLGENDAISIEGGLQTWPASTHQARNIRVTNCDLSGGVLINDARDVVIANNRIVKDWTTTDTPNVRVQGYCDNVLINGNFIYRCATGPSDPATIDIVAYSAGTTTIKPANVQVINNTILSRNGLHGIKILGTGQPNAYDAAVAYVAGMMVRSANVTYVSIAGSTGATPASSPSSWSVWDEATGDGSGGMVVVENNLIDCLNDGQGAGAHGIFVDANGSGPNLRARICKNRIRAANTHGVHVKTTGAPSPYLYLAIDDNFGWDDQNTPTQAATVYLEAPVRVNNLHMNGNIAHTGVTAAVAGITSGFWQTGGDLTPQYAGFGTPESVVTAPIGATYQRSDGTTNTTFYRKESGTGNTGWIPASQLPAGTEAHFTGVVASNQTRTSEATNYLTLTDLDVPADTNEVWLVDYDISYDGAAAADLRWQLTVPPGATFFGSATSLGSAATTNDTSQIQMLGGIVHGSPLTAGCVGAGTLPVLRIRGTYTTTSTAGNLSFKFVQSTSSATATTVYAGSRVECRRHSP